MLSIYYVIAERKMIFIVMSFQSITRRLELSCPKQDSVLSELLPRKTAG